MPYFNIKNKMFQNENFCQEMSAEKMFVISFIPEYGTFHVWHYLDGLMQDCSNSIANALELLQSCTKPAICTYLLHITSCSRNVIFYSGNFFFCYGYND